jgi:hypothetical protein
MDGLLFLRERIPAYADYGDEESRHLVDKQVRAYVGEALTGLRERLAAGLGRPQSDRLERALMLCEFTNQQLMRMLDHARLADREFEELHEVDRELVAVADRAEAIEASALDGYLEEVTSLFARRARAVSWIEDRR